MTNKLPNGLPRRIECPAAWYGPDLAARRERWVHSLTTAEIAELDMTIDGGAIQTYRAKVNISFKYEGGP